MHGSRKQLGTKLIAKIQEGSGIEVMLTYPIKLEEDDGTIMATSPDFPSSRRSAMIGTRRSPARSGR